MDKLDCNATCHWEQIPGLVLSEAQTGIGQSIRVEYEISDVQVDCGGQRYAKTRSLGYERVCHGASKGDQSRRRVWTRSKTAVTSWQWERSCEEVPWRLDCVPEGSGGVEGQVKCRSAGENIWLTRKSAIT